jgi:hypothetical protein
MKSVGVGSKRPRLQLPKLYSAVPMPLYLPIILMKNYFRLKDINAASNFGIN